MYLQGFKLPESMPVGFLGVWSWICLEGCRVWDPEKFDSVYGSLRESWGPGLSLNLKEVLGKEGSNIPTVLGCLGHTLPGDARKRCVVLGASESRQ